MKIKWDTFCGRQNVTTDTQTVDRFGEALCCSNCYSVYLARKSWWEVYG
jgi:hypothetical protein